MKKITSIVTLFLWLLFFVDSGNIANANLVNNDTLQIANNQNNLEITKENSQETEKQDETRRINTFISFIRFSDDGDENVYEQRGGFDKLKSIFKGDDSLESYINDISYGKTKINAFFDESEDGNINTYVAPYKKSYYMSNKNGNTEGYKKDTVEQPKEGMQVIDFCNRTEQEQRQHDLINGALRDIISKYKDKISDNPDNNKFVFVVPEQEGWSDVLWSKVFEDLFDCGMYRVSMITIPNTLDNAAELKYQKNVVRHEYLHLLQFPDMYRYINDDVEPVGKWSLMGSSEGIPTIYEKMKYGKWINDDGTAIKEIKEDGDYELSPCTADPNSNIVAYKIPVPESYNEYFMVEYRKDSTNDGLLVYRVNTTIKFGGGDAGGPPDEVYVLRGDNLNDALIDGVKNKNLTDFSLCNGTNGLGITIYII